MLAHFDQLQGIPQNSASFLISIIGITNTFGRVFCGYIADFPKVDSLLLNNICLLVSTLAVASTPFCTTYEHYMAMSIFFGLAICKWMHRALDKRRWLSALTHIPIVS